MEQLTFDQRFERAFAGGLADVKFFVRRSEPVTVEELKADALSFQEAIESENFHDVAGVD